MTPKNARYEITTFTDTRRRFLTHDGRLVFEDGSPVQPGIPNPNRFDNLPPTPSALDSVWQTIWKFLKEAW